MCLTKLSSKQKIVILAAVAFIIFMLPQVLRVFIYHDSMLGSTTYYHVRLAELVVEGASSDPLSFGGRPITYPPGFSWMIYLVPLSMFVLAPFIGALGILIGYYFVKELGFTDKEALYSSLFLLFNPAYAYFSVHLNPRLPAVVLMVLAYLMVNKDNRLINYSAFFPVILSLMISPLIGSALILIGLIIFRKKFKRLLVPFSSAFTVFLAYFIPIVIKHGLPRRYKAYNIFTEFGRGLEYFFIESGVTAVSFTSLLVLLATYGFFRLKGEEYRPIREWLLVGFFASLLIFNRLNDLLIFPVSLVAGTVFAAYFKDFRDKLRLKRFSIKALKLVVVVYLLVYIIVPGAATIKISPTPEQYDAMTWINQNTPENATIMAYWWEGHYITSVAERKNIMDAYLEFAPEVNERYEDIKRVMSTCRANETVRIMKKYNSRYLLYKVLKKDSCSGFPFVSKDGRFEEVYSNEDYRVYKLNDKLTSPGSDLCEAVMSKGSQNVQLDSKKTPSSETLEKE